MLTLRRTGLSSPAYQDLLDYIITEDGRDVGRLYEDRHSKPELRWFWSITVYVNPKLGIKTSGRAPSLDEAKAQFLTSLAEVSGRLELLSGSLLCSRHVVVAFTYRQEESRVCLKMRALFRPFSADVATSRKDHRLQQTGQPRIRARARQSQQEGQIHFPRDRWYSSHPVVSPPPSPKPG